MPVRSNIVLIGGSAGALKPLVEIAKALPKGFPAAIFVVIHAPPGARRLLTGIIGTSCALEVRYAEHDATFEPGCMYVAPPDRHLLLSHDRMQVIRGPRENRSRPAIDPLFRTAARAFESRVTAVLVSGLLNDGTYGFRPKICQRDTREPIRLPSVTRRDGKADQQGISVEIRFSAQI